MRGLVVPLALIALGFGYRLEIAIVAFSCFWPMLILARAAMRSVEPRLIEVARALRLSPPGAALKIVAPAAGPRLFVALRLASGGALVVEIAVNPQGLGYEAMTASSESSPTPASRCGKAGRCDGARRRAAEPVGENFRAAREHAGRFRVKGELPPGDRHVACRLRDRRA